MRVMGMCLSTVCALDFDCVDRVLRRSVCTGVLNEVGSAFACVRMKGSVAGVCVLAAAVVEVDVGLNGKGPGDEKE